MAFDYERHTTRSVPLLRLVIQESENFENIQWNFSYSKRRGSPNKVRVAEISKFVFKTRMYICITRHMNEKRYTDDLTTKAFFIFKGFIG